MAKYKYKDIIEIDVHEKITHIWLAENECIFHLTTNVT